MKFHTNITDDYNIRYLEKQDKGTWQELEVGKEFSNKHSLTFFCGGSVSGLDWAQTKDHDDNFLAVACNNEQSAQSNMRLEQTFKSCIQVYKLQHLVNEK
jgi:hypothetical protein